MKTAIVLLAPGFEEIEAIAPIDLLRRAGIQVTVLAVAESLSVLGGHGLTVTADAPLAGNVGLADAIVVPGGSGGSQAIAASEEAGLLIMRHARAGALVAAICAAPAVVLGPLGLLDGHEFTCYPGMEKRVVHGRFSEARVVTDRRIITSRGAGTAEEFGLTVAAALVGADSAGEVATAILARS